MSDNSEGGGVIVVPLTSFRRIQMLRRLLVATHGMTGLCLGIFSFIRPPDDRNRSFSTLKLIPGWPVTWGAWVLIAGTAILVGLFFSFARVCRWGLIALSAWTTTMILGYLSAAIWHNGAMWQIPLYVGLTFSYAMHAAYLHEERPT